MSLCISLWPNSCKCTAWNMTSMPLPGLKTCAFWASGARSSVRGPLSLPHAQWSPLPGGLYCAPPTALSGDWRERGSKDDVSIYETKVNTYHITRLRDIYTCHLPCTLPWFHFRACCACSSASERSHSSPQALATQLQYSVKDTVWGQRCSTLLYSYILKSCMCSVHYTS